MSVNTPSHVLRDEAQDGAAVGVSVDRFAETKAAFKTTEFVVFLVAVVGVLVASALVGDSDGRGDVFLADKAWFYVTLLDDRLHGQPRPGQGRRPRAPRRLIRHDPRVGHVTAA